MPVTEQVVDCYNNGYDSLSLQGKVVHQTSNTELYSKKVSGVMTAYTTAPSGTQATWDFLTNNFPSATYLATHSADKYYTMIADLAGNKLKYADGSTVELMWNTSLNKFQCGRPN